MLLFYLSPSSFCLFLSCDFFIVLGLNLWLSQRLCLRERMFGHLEFQLDLFSVFYMFQNLLLFPLIIITLIQEVNILKIWLNTN